MLIHGLELLRLAAVCALLMIVPGIALDVWRHRRHLAALAAAEKSRRLEALSAHGKEVPRP